MCKFWDRLRVRRSITVYRVWVRRKKWARTLVYIVFGSLGHVSLFDWPGYYFLFWKTEKRRYPYRILYCELEVCMFGWKIRYGYRLPYSHWDELWSTTVNCKVTVFVRRQFFHFLPNSNYFILAWFDIFLAYSLGSMQGPILVSDFAFLNGWLMEREFRLSFFVFRIDHFGQHYVLRRNPCRWRIFGNGWFGVCVHSSGWENRYKMPEFFFLSVFEKIFPLFARNLAICWTLPHFATHFPVGPTPCL